MKNFKKILVVCVVFLNGCAVSQKMWNAGSYQESFKNYFIDEENNRVVLIGENNGAYKGKENYYYAIKDDNENITKIFEIGRAKGIEMSFGYTQARGLEVFPWSMWIGFNKELLSKDDIIFLQENKFKTGSKIGYSYDLITLTRYPSSKEFSKNYKTSSILSFEGVQIFEKNTPLQTTGKALATPFTLAADILLLTITIPYFIYHQVKESQTQHFCEGEFCGYDKIPKSNQNKK